MGYPTHEIGLMKVFSHKEKLEEAKKPTFRRIERTENLCFVLMPFSRSFQSICSDVVLPAMRETGLECKRADDTYNTRPIIEDIREHIQRAKILIADLTTRNPKVFYEVGISHALGKEVILITQTMEDVPFDLRH